ncbi:hypothetical protein M378DRAFT_794995 [Amanita muscaria Koide BX008]|uniref:Uncharacterized protein n=1 Tax=Amanita muscaria (strain Koide BX008) TaxID=946122 RepID=A0A0C2X0T7_AMAMK|nr:hypothetical protein M378DRAFT_794995 [Amanita muscaria Koide BX008]
MRLSWPSGVAPFYLDQPGIISIKRAMSRVKRRQKETRIALNEEVRFRDCRQTCRRPPRLSIRYPLTRVSRVAHPDSRHRHASDEKKNRRPWSASTAGSKPGVSLLNTRYLNRALLEANDIMRKFGCR